MAKMKIAIILGTRPEIIKLAPIVKEAERRGLDYYVLHTGQHYNFELDTKIFEDLEIPPPKYNLGVGGKPYRMQVGNMVREIMSILNKDMPDVVIVQGDTNSVLAGALAANKLNIVLAHLEAGLRSHDLSMPEEVNRILTDHISDLLLAPTKQAEEYLKEEGVEEQKICYTGNTVADAIKQNIDIAHKKSQILDELGLSSGKYVLITAHRAENVDVESRFRGIIDGLRLVAQDMGLPIIYSLHPRAKKRLEEFKIDVPAEIRLIDSMGYLDFIKLQSSAKLIITDSGGLQEEACMLHIPCVTVRDNTERPETVEIGANVLAGTNPEKILSAARLMISKNLSGLKSPYGDGDAAEKTLDMLMKVQRKNTNEERGN